MGMGKRKRAKQDSLFIIPTASLARSASHDFYEHVNRVLAADGFDDYVEGLCAPFFVEGKGRHSIPPGTYFRMLLVGFFEGLDSERGIDWRVSDSMALRPFLGYDLSESTPDHSTLSRTRQRYPVEVHEEVFAWMLGVLAKGGLLKGKTVAVDATTLEANAAMRSLQRRDTGQGYQEYLTELAKASGMETPTRQDLAKLDKKRKKKTSNKDWQHPHDPDAKVTKMKDRRTHLAHKVEHVVDLDTEAVVAVSLCDACEGDTSSLPWSLLRAEAHLEVVARDPAAAKGLHEHPLAEVVTDKGYHSNETLVDLQAAGTRSYLSEPDRGRRKWKGKAAAQAAVYANRRRIHGTRGQRLQRLRAERAERSFAHTYETGGLRRLHLRGRSNILKRLLIHAAGFNLGLVLRQLLGAGTPRAFAARIRALRKLCGVHLAVIRALGRIHRDLQAEMDQYLRSLCVGLILARPGHGHHRSTGC
ncbi:transposase [Candidatus Latescibacterota bacterium]